MGVRSLKMKLQAFQVKKLLRPFWYKTNLMSKKVFLAGGAPKITPCDSGALSTQMGIRPIRTKNALNTGRPPSPNQGPYEPNAPLQKERM